LRELITEGKLKEAQDYIKCYFIKGSAKGKIAIIKWCPLSYPDRFNFLSVIDVEKHHLKKSMKFGDWNACKWFFDEYDDIYNITMDKNKPIIFNKKVKKQNLPMINVFPGYLYEIPRKKEHFDKKTLDAVNKIWEFIKESWCSGKKDQFEYIKKWLCCMINGRKMDTYVYLKGDEGTGKSMIIDFIRHYVIGTGVSYKTSSTESIIGSWTAHFVGKTFVVMEEPDSATASQWKCTANALKDLVTSPTIECKEKFKTNFECPNFMSLIVLTNNNAIMIHYLSRRPVVLDVSNKFIQNLEFFKNFKNMIMNKRVGRAFYWLAKAYAKKLDDWYEADIPLTTNKKTLMSLNLPSHLVFIKQEYLLKKRAVGIDEKKPKKKSVLKLSDFYEKYKRFCQRSKIEKVEAKGIFDSFLQKDFPGCIYRGAQGYSYIRIEYKVIHSLYDKKGWILDTDDFVEWGFLNAIIISN